MLPVGIDNIGPLTDKLPLKVELPPTAKSVPTNNFLAIPTPPAIVNAPPTVELVASVVFVKLVAPDTPKVPVRDELPPIFKSPTVVRLFIPVTLLLVSLNNRILL